MTRRHRPASLAITAGLTSVFDAGHQRCGADRACRSLDVIRGAVNGARAQSTCPALTYSGQLEAAAQ
jgi:hypothetical protein